jgi:hypothetical protein
MNSNSPVILHENREDANLRGNAMSLNDEGYTVFPVGADKRPLEPWKQWQTCAQFLTQVDEMPWTRAAHVAVVCGCPNAEMTVLDFDCKNGEPGLEAYQQFLLENPGDWPTQRTRSGGIHVLTRGAARNSALYLDGVRCGDVRGAGGYIIAWEPIKIPRAENLPPMPALVGCVTTERKRIQPPSRPASTSTVQSFAGDSSRYVQAVLEAEVQSVTNAITGTRNETLNRAAFNLGTLIGAGTLAESEARHALELAAEGAGLSEVEANATIRSGLEAGKKQPREMGQIKTAASQWKTLRSRIRAQYRKVSE